MAWIGWTDEDDAGERLAELYARVVDPDHGRVDHIMKIHALHPEGLAAHEALYRAVMSGTKGLRKVDRELIAFHVSRLNDCHY